MFSRIDNFFTDKRKGFAAIGALVFALLWMFLWNIFPMEFYSLFFADIVGSNILIILLNTVVLLPSFYIFTKLTRTDLSFIKTVLVNIFCLAAVDYVFSIFFFSDYFFWCVIAIVLHAAVNVWVFGSARVRDGKAPKGMKAPMPETEKSIKKQPLISIIWAVVFAFVTDIISFGLMYIIAHIYAY